MSFENAVDSFLQKHPCEDAVSAKKALMRLYATMKELAAFAGGDAMYWHKIQQLQTWSPLRFFWETLASDESVVIRAAAKGNICEAAGCLSEDPEVGFMAGKNLEVMNKMLGIADFEEFRRRLNMFDGLPKAQELWVKAGFGSFGPNLTIREL